MTKLVMTSCVIAALCAAMHAQTPAPTPQGQQGQQGQQPPPATRPGQTAPTARPPQTAVPGEVPAPAAQAPRPGTPANPVGAQQNTWQNIKLDLTITDAANASTQLRKVLSLYIADGRQGQVRSQSEQGLINVDARPLVRPDGKTILLQLTVEYRQGVSGSLFSESLHAMVLDGKVMTLSQTADPSGDRKVSVEVLATIQKN